MSLSIKDIARLAGVSTATVSRALSQPERVSEETRKTVMDVVNAQGYRVNSMARSLRRKRTDTVLAIIPNLANPFYAAIFDSMQATLQDHGRSLVITDSRTHRPDQPSPLTHWHEARIDGLICFDADLPEAILAELQGPDLAGRVVFASAWPKTGCFPSVRSDNRHGMRLAVDHLHGLGHRSIAYLSGPAENSLNIERREAVAEALVQHGLSLPQSAVIDGDFSLEAGRLAAARVAALSPRPTAVVCASDQLAIGLIFGLMSMGLSVPEDISVIGFDDIATARYYNPPLTTVRQDRAGLGVRASMLLIDGLEGRKPRHQIEILPVTLEVRGSTMAPVRMRSARHS